MHKSRRLPWFAKTGLGQDLLLGSRISIANRGTRAGLCASSHGKRNQVWRYDFVEARTHDGRSLRLLTVIDEFKRMFERLCDRGYRFGKRCCPARNRSSDAERVAQMKGSKQPVWLCRRAQAALHVRGRPGAGSDSPVPPKWEDEFLRRTAARSKRVSPEVSPKIQHAPDGMPIVSVKY